VELSYPTSGLGLPLDWICRREGEALRLYPGWEPNVLVGGFGNTISLQPISLQGGVGLNVAGGIGAVSLTYQP
jgi:hypothetical protein